MSNLWSSVPAIIEAWRAGLLRRDSIARNVAAGAVVGVVALPLAMAFAIASGAKPEQGLYTALVAGLIVSLAGGSRVQIAGPTGAFTVLLAGVTATYGIAGLQLVTLMAGVMLLLLGLTRMGGVIRFIPESVVLGFTAGIAVVVWVGQWENFFGLPSVEGHALFEKLPGLVAAFPHAHLATTVMGLVCLAVLVLWPKLPYAGAVPAPLVALVGGTVYVAAFHPAGVATVGSVFGGIPRGLPPLTLPQVSLDTLVALAQPAFAVALLGAIESLLSATVADGLIGTKHDPNQELVGQGLANVGSALLGGFAATGAIARTATNIRHGGDSPVAGITHAVTVAVVLVALAPLAANVPLTALAAILFVVAFNMSQVGRVVRIAARAPRSDVAVMLVTLALSVFADLTLAVEVGVILALLNFFRRMSGTVEVRALDCDELYCRLPADSGIEVPADVVVYTIDGPFFFGAIEQFESALAHTGTDPAAVVIKLANVPFIDLTGLVALGDAIVALRKRDIEVVLCSASPSLAQRLERGHVNGSVAVGSTATLAEALAALEAHRS